MDECAGSGHWWRAGLMTYRDSAYTASSTGKTQACENISFITPHIMVMIAVEQKPCVFQI